MLKNCLAVFVVLVVAFSGSNAKAEKRIALVIGNSAYTKVGTLANAANDARLVGNTLHNLGFDLGGRGPLLNLGRREFITAIREFSRKLRTGNPIGLFFYAGHAIEHEGRNYMVPVDAYLEVQDEIPFELIDMNLVLNQMRLADNSLNILVLDACRNNPFAGRKFRGVDRGLNRMDAPKGTLISFATRPDDVAQDGPPGKNSPYSAAFAKAIQVPNMELLSVFNNVGVMVSTETNGEQQPWFSSSPIEGRFIFNAEEQEQTDKKTTKTGLLELEFWNAVKGSKDPEAFETYIAQYPNGSFVMLARLNIRKLSGREQAERGPKVNRLDLRFVTLGETIVRLSPHPTSEHLGRFPANQAVLVNGRVVDENWYRIRFRGGAAYVHGSEIRAVSADAYSEWQMVKNSEDPKELKSYANRFPDSPYADLSKQRSKELRRKTIPTAIKKTSETDIEADLAAWNAIKDDYTQEDLDDYLRRFPNGLFIERIEVIRGAFNRQEDKALLLDKLSKP